jgi:hypothetical protein
MGIGGTASFNGMALQSSFSSATSSTGPFGISFQAGGFWGGVADVIGKIWNLPNTSLGVALGAPVLALSAVASLAWSAIYVATIGRFGGFEWVGTRLSIGNNAIQFTNFPVGSKGGLTLGNTQIYRNASPEKSDFWYGIYQKTGLHEEAHTYQSQVLGPFFIPAYLSSGMPFTGLNPFEQAATAYATGSGGWWP